MNENIESRANTPTSSAAQGAVGDASRGMYHNANTSGDAFQSQSHCITSAQPSDATAQPNWTANHPEQTGVGDICAPGPIVDQVKRYLLRFEDADRGDVLYDDEQEARTAFANAEGRGWNCHLFEHAERQATQPRVDLTDERAAFEEWIKRNHRRAGFHFGRSSTGIYKDNRIAAKWSAWQAALASTPPAPQSEQEPVAWMVRHEESKTDEYAIHGIYPSWLEGMGQFIVTPLYATQQPFPAPAVQSGELPDLPEAKYAKLSDLQSGVDYYFDADQMRAYAERAVLEAAPASSAVSKQSLHTESSYSNLSNNSISSPEIPDNSIPSNSTELDLTSAIPMADSKQSLRTQDHSGDVNEMIKPDTSTQEVG